MWQSDEEVAAEITDLNARGLEAVTEAFERERHRLRLFVTHRTDQRLLGRLDWDDVLQEAFIVIQTRYVSFLERPAVPFYVWMRAMTGQVLVDLHRKHLGVQKRDAGREVSLHQRLPFQSTAASLGSLLAASGTSPSGATMRDEEYDLLYRNLETMSELDREVLVLRHLEQLTNTEVAHVLGIDKSAATKRYIRALRRLREQFDDRSPE